MSVTPLGQGWFVDAFLQTLRSSGAFIAPIESFIAPIGAENAPEELNVCSRNVQIMHPQLH